MVANFSDLVGKTLLSIENHGDRVNFICDDGTVYAMFHAQDGSESVNVEEVIGDLDDIIGKPILKAEEVTSDENPDGYERLKYEQESFTWTFYHLATIKGHVTIRWYGSSNGYYSERVEFHIVS